MPSTYSDVKLNIDGIKSGILKLVGLFGKAGGAANAFNLKAAMGFKNTALASAALNVAVGLVLVVAFQKIFSVIKKGFTESIRVTKEYNQELANTQSVARGTVAELKELDAAARRAGETTRFTATEAAEALYYLASAGFEATEAVDALGGVLALAQATGTDMAITAEEIAVVISQFSLEAYEASRVANVFAAAITNSQATMEKMVFGFQQAGPIAAGLGISLEETAAAMELIFNAGFRGQRGGRALRNIMGDLSYESSATSKKLTALGLDFDKFTTSTNTLADVFTYLNEEGLTTSQTFAAFGKVTSGQAAILVNSGAAAWKEMTDAVTNTNKAYEAAFIQNDTLVGDQYRLKSAAEALGITFGNLLEPTLRRVTQTSFGFIRALNRGLKVFTGQSTTASRLADAVTLLRQEMTGYDVIVKELEESYDDLNTVEKENLELMKERAKQDIDDQARKVLENYSKALDKLAKLKETSDELSAIQSGETTRAEITSKKLGLIAGTFYDIGIVVKDFTRDVVKAIIGIDVLNDKTTVTFEESEEAANNYRLALEDLEAPLNELAVLYEKHPDLLEELAETYPVVAGVIQDYIDKLPAKREAEAEAAAAALIHIDATEDYIVAMAEAIGFTDKYTKALFNLTQKQRENKAEALLETGDVEGALEIRREALRLEEEMIKASLLTELEAKQLKSQEEIKDAAELIAVLEAQQNLHDEQLIAAQTTLYAEYVIIEEEYREKHQENLDDIEEDEQEVIDNRRDAMKDLYDDISDFSSSYVESLERERDAFDNMTADALEDLGDFLEASKIRQNILDREHARELDNIEEEKEALEDGVDASILSEEQKTKKKAEINDAYLKALSDAEAVYAAKQQQLAIDDAAKTKTAAEKRRKEKQDLLDDEAKADEKAKEEKLKKDKEYYDAMIDVAKKAATEIFGSFETLFKQLSNNRLEQLDRDLEAKLEKEGVAEDSALESLEKELKQAKENADEEEIIELQKAIARQKIEDDFAKKKAKVQYDSAMTSWVLDSATSGSKAALAIIEAIASAPWPLNLPAIGFATIQGGTAVTSQLLSKPQPPKFYSGGIVRGSTEGTTAIVGDKGRTEAIFNPDQMANLLMAIAGGGGPENGGKMEATFIFNSNDREQARFTVDLINRGIYQIDKNRGLRGPN